jgi:DNA-binding winged helix-turn-helix (wHTH) protein
MTWLSRVERSKDNLYNKQKALIDFKKNQNDFFFNITKKGYWIDSDFTIELTKSMIQIMNSTKFKNFIF